MKSIASLLSACLLSFTPAAPAQAPPPKTETLSMESVQHLQDYQVIEFRRYVTAPGRRADFIRYFDTYFPEAFEQLGAMVFGQFAERGHPDRFTWLRGFRDINARPVVNAAFYYGPLWREHRIKVNAILPDSDNVMLMRPLHPQRGITVLPAVDPVLEERGAQGIVVAQVFAVKKGSEAAFAQRAEQAFAAYDGDGVRTAGSWCRWMYPTISRNCRSARMAPGWCGWASSRTMPSLQRTLAPKLDAAERALAKDDSVRGPVERVVMDPTPRSRLRWLDAGVVSGKAAP